MNIYLLTPLFMGYEIYILRRQLRPNATDSGCFQFLFTVAYLGWIIATWFTPYWQPTLLIFLLGFAGLGTAKGWVKWVDFLVSMLLLIMFMMAGLQNWEPLF